MGTISHEHVLSHVATTTSYELSIKSRYTVQVVRLYELLQYRVHHTSYELFILVYITAGVFQRVSSRRRAGRPYNGRRDRKAYGLCGDVPSRPSRESEKATLVYL